MHTSQKYEHWMEVETYYALSKFADENGRHCPQYQYPYWLHGVSSGGVSYRSSALGYMQRALSIAREYPRISPDGGLRLVQNLGKAAHNLIALDATARSYTPNGGDGRLLWKELEMFGLLAERLTGGAPISHTSILSAQSQRRDVFADLQERQNSGDIVMFHRLLLPEALLAANQFVSAADIYGWPEPGHTSGEVIPWTEAEAISL